MFLPLGNTQCAFHHAKSIRDVFLGLPLVVFAGLGYVRLLAWVLLLGALIPNVDFTVVLSVKFQEQILQLEERERPLLQAQRKRAEAQMLEKQATPTKTK